MFTRLLSFSKAALNPLMFESPSSKHTSHLHLCHFVLHLLIGFMIKFLFVNKSFSHIACINFMKFCNPTIQERRKKMPLTQWARIAFETNPAGTIFILNQFSSERVEGWWLLPLHINSNYGVLNNEYSIRILLVVKTVLMVTFTACSLVHHLLDVQSGRNWPKGGQQKGEGGRKDR